jgi:serine protease AprX
MWQYDAPRAAVAGSDSHTYTVNVPRGVTNLKVTLSHPSLAAIGANGTVYDVTVKDAAGKVVGTGTESDLASGAGTNSTFIDLAKANAKYGTFTIEVSGQYAASDPDTLDSDSALGRVVAIQVAELKHR